MSTAWAQLMISTHAIFKIILYSQGQNNLSIPMDTVVSPASSAVFHFEKGFCSLNNQCTAPCGDLQNPCGPSPACTALGAMSEWASLHYGAHTLQIKQPFLIHKDSVKGTENNNSNNKNTTNVQIA